jgi:hypothetical protein
MTPQEQDERLKQLGIQRGLIRTDKCQHRLATLCRHLEEDPGYETNGQPYSKEFTFVAYQCDECGAVLPKDVSPDDLDTPNLPPLDPDLWQDTIRAAGGKSLHVTLSFWSRSLKR